LTAQKERNYCIENIKSEEDIAKMLQSVKFTFLSIVKLY